MSEAPGAGVGLRAALRSSAGWRGKSGGSRTSGNYQGARLGPPTSRRPERLQPLPQTSSGFLGDACLHEGHNHGAVPSGVLFLK